VKFIGRVAAQPPNRPRFPKVPTAV